MAWYFSADWHLNHGNIIKYCCRPFLNKEEQELLNSCTKSLLPVKSIQISKESIERMNSTIIESTNKVVNEDDNLVILGDFCWSTTPKKQLSELVSKIRCKNLYLVWGNHDNRQTFLPYFKSVYDQYTFCIEGQHIFVSHYPCRSWYLSSYGSWMLYGHVHNKLWHQDNGVLSSQEHSSIKDALSSLLKNYCDNFEDDHMEKAINSIRKVFRKNLLCLDVGVDNTSRSGVSFGTPWSFSEIKVEMEKRILARDLD